MKLHPGWLFAFLFLSPFYSFTQLTIEVPELSSTGGSIFIAVYNSAEHFMESEHAVYREIVSVKEENFSHSISSLPAGTYAIAIFHDSNDNQVLDKGLFGIPKEGYGFSNDAKGRFGPPSFQAASFSLGEEALTIQIHLN